MLHQVGVSFDLIYSALGHLVDERLLIASIYSKGGEIHFSVNRLQTAFEADEKVLEETPLYSIWVCLYSVHTSSMFPYRSKCPIGVRNTSISCYSGVQTLHYRLAIVTMDFKIVLSLLMFG